LYANVASNGAGAFNCSLSLCTLSNNCATRHGGGIYVDGLVSPVITNCTFAGNTAGNTGGGLYASAANQLLLNRCVFSGNAATNYGGGYGGPAGAVDNCVFSNNWAGNAGGAIYIPNPGGGRAFTNCGFYNNAASTSGGGTYSANLSQCSIIGNQAPSGGGAYNGTLTACSLSSNSATLAGGGIYAGTLDSCVLAGNRAGNGGAAANTTLWACTLADNSAATNGGGAWNGTLYNCLLTRNNALSGGGAYGNTLYNCTLVSNSATNSGGGTAGSFRAYNSIIYYNTAPTSSNYASGTFSACCTMPLSINNISNAPVFVDRPGGNFRLQTNSPCINAGNNSYANGVDLDHRTRVLGGTVDIGAYEFQGPGMGEFIGWLQQYGLPTDGSADYTDADTDRMNNWQEWICGTEPTNSLSVLSMLAPSSAVSGVTVNWQGVSNRTYVLECSTNILVPPAFTPIQSNIVGQAGTTSFTDTNAAGAGPFFYRVGVQ
jgi:predicted outer membrane repeat protein